ncbi:rubrerythrin family protein [Agrobacterium vitis]|uniref:ferritin-like domain-containing protein n=1 Tax=Rhizobium/Agrobacterium group TaxID=227290 RepID=UPI0008733119|nr:MULTISPECIES: ferritin family protein [Rhizobium/Agrobacterium group]MCF1449322.1 rubrerythrin family protein [Allorhizobium ampelinum]MCF1464166.1 rubrerythrin family protein [Allorhizobium ampelinum]MCF1484839.1 rubrerythrin family protein [Allorhizobium ampelinum]MUO71967.1 rubrerythrin family protein [Agrobacterium vitis]
MPETTQEPWLVKSMPELMALARAMEEDAVAGYRALALRMRAENRADLAAVFDRLVAEEQGHLENVDRWRTESGGAVAAVSMLVPEASFDDEGAGIVAPELLSAYRAFSLAVRNEERAFVFWTYIAAHAPSKDIRMAAERMAKEELGHVATLRRERRLAFHAQRRDAAKTAKSDLPTLEALLADHLQRRAAMPGAAPSNRLLALAAAAQARAAGIAAIPFVATPLLDSLPEPVSGQAVSLSEFLLDCYLDLAEREKDEPPRLQAQAFAGQLIACLQFLRAHPAA